MPDKLKLTTPSFIVLGLVELLSDWKAETTPYAMKQFAAGSLDNFWSVAHAQLYSEPVRLAAAGYLTEKQEQSGRRRKFYRLTEKGRKALAQWREDASASPTELRHTGVLKLFFGADPQAVSREQIGVHQGKLNEFKRIRDELGDKMADGQRIALEAGISFEINMIQFWQKLIDGTLDLD